MPTNNRNVRRMVDFQITPHFVIVNMQQQQKFQNSNKEKEKLKLVSRAKNMQWKNI